jgi:hypothetical protein
MIFPGAGLIDYVNLVEPIRNLEAEMYKSKSTTNHFHLRRGLVFGVIIVTALFAFEVFNYSTTEFALEDLLGDLSFAGIRWATILAIAFCGIDFAGIARLFTPALSNDPKQTERHPAYNEAWYLFGAWLLAASMNAMLTWWGISLAILERQDIGNAVASREVLLRVVPVFVAVLVWLIRVLIIGTFSVAGDRLFTQDDQQVYVPAKVAPRNVAVPAPVPNSGSRAPAFRAASSMNKTTGSATLSSGNSYRGSYAEKPEPTYHPISASPTIRSNQISNPPSNSYNRTGTSVRR